MDDHGAARARLSPTVEVHRSRTDELSAAELRQARELMHAAYGDRFDDVDWEHALGGVHALVLEDGALAGHAAVVKRRLLHQGRSIRTGYLEALGVRGDRRRRGYAAAAMRAVEETIDAAEELGALSDGTGIEGFYQRRGWLTWAGPTFVDCPDGVVWTPDDDGGVLVWRTPASPPLDLSAPLGCDWREGDVW
jgi:aminoglycoside 2'-N-acetyltransferase I